MKRKTRRLLSAMLVLCMAATMFCVNVPQAQAAAKYKKSVTKTFTLPAYTQYQIFVEVQPSKSGDNGVKATVTSKAKKAADRAAWVATQSEEKQIDSKHKKVSVVGYSNGGEMCLYLTNGSGKKQKCTVKFSGLNGAKVKYLRYEDAGEGVG